MRKLRKRKEQEPYSPLPQVAYAVRGGGISAREPKWNTETSAAFFAQNTPEPASLESTTHSDGLLCSCDQG